MVKKFQKWSKIIQKLLKKLKNGRQGEEITKCC